MHYFPVEPPGSTVVSKCNVLPISGQNICGQLFHEHNKDRKQRKQQQILPLLKRKTQWRHFSRTIPTVLGLPANTFPFFSRTSLAWICWLTMRTLWEPIIREYVCPYFFCRSLKNTWGACRLLRQSRLPITGSAGRWGGSRRPCEDLTLSHQASTARPTNTDTNKHKYQSMAALGEVQLRVCHASQPRAARAGVELIQGNTFYAFTSMPEPWLWLLKTSPN